MNLSDLQGHLSSFCLKISLTYFSGLWCSPGDLMKDDIASDLELSLKVISGTERLLEHV